MLSEVRFVVPGEPQGKGRPRAVRVGHGVRMYTPAKTEAYEDLVALQGRKAMAGRDPLQGPLALDLVAVVSVPTSWTKKRRAAALAGMEWPAKKPDADNVAKTIADGLNGIVYSDDAQVVDLRVVKRYGELAGVIVKVSQIEYCAGA